MEPRLLQVITFATSLTGGNPAFVLLGADGADADALSAVSALVRADVLAVVSDPGADRPRLRFVNSSGAHPGAGHALHAAAHVALAAGGRDRIEFVLPDAQVRPAWREGARVATRVPVLPLGVPLDAGVVGAALGARPVEALATPFGPLAVLADPEAVRTLAPDLAAVAALGGVGTIVTAAGGSSDVVVRVFAPNAGLPEDPVCGTAHRLLGPYWAPRLGPRLHSRHLSPRGGDLWLDLADDGTIAIAGLGVTALEARLHLPLA